VRRRLLVGISALPALLLVGALDGTAGAASPPGAHWRFDELVGTTAEDSAGDHDGTSTDVVPGLPGLVGTAYGFNGGSSVVRVPSADDLNPGSADFSFGAAVNFTEVPPDSTWDVVRKGVSGTKGGYYKLELFDGGSTNGARARCYFRGANGNSKSVVGGKNLNDGRWHRVTCSRKGGKVIITVDGKTSSNSFSLGKLANTAEITIGAKPTGGDAYLGRIDEVRLTFP
jgi:hypothetical protein